MFKILLLQAMHGLSDERCEYLIKDGLSFMPEPRRVCRRLQPLRGWSDDGEEDGGELLA